MTPAENIYRSDFDDVDGLDPVEFTNDSIDTLRDMMEDDDGQPDMDQEYADLYAYGPEWDCYHDTIDYPEDWG